MSPRLPRPRKELKGFAKVRLEPSAKRTVEIPLGSDAFALYDPVGKVWVTEAGQFRVFVGSSSRDIRAEGTYTLEQPRTVRR